MPNAFGEWVSAQREKVNMTIDEFAEKTKKSKSAIWNTEKGQTMPRLDTAARMTKVLGVPLWKALKELGDKEDFKKPKARN